MTAQAPIVGRYYDGAPLRIGNAIHIANPDQKQWAKHRYLFSFGQIGCTFVVAYADDIYDALEEAAAFCIEQGWRGHVIPHDADPSELGCDCADPFDCDAHTYTESGWLASEEWHVDEDPTNEQLRRIHRA